MQNGAILEYSDRVTRLLADASYRPVPVTPGGADMYRPMTQSPGAEFNPDAPFTVCYLVGWSPELQEQRKAWEQLATASQHSVRLTYPEANVVTLDIGNVTKGESFPLLAAQYYALLRRSIRGNIVFLDTDVLAYNRFDMFALDFDVGLTDCDDLWPMQPFNAGVMFSKDTPGAQRYWDTAAEVAWALPSNFAPWYAYQIGLRTAYDMHKGETEFVIFPHEQFNFTPERDLEQTDAFFVHSRGMRKNLQFDYIRKLIARHA